MNKLFYFLTKIVTDIFPFSDGLKKILVVILLVFTAGLSFSQITNNTIDYTNGTHATICATPAENGTATLTAPSGTIFTTVSFASYGTPTGSCNGFSTSSCNASTSQSVVESYLLGKTGTISIPANNTTFSDPCSGTVKKLYVQATYTQPVCSGTSPGAITGSTPSGSTGYTYSWEKSTTSSSTGFTSISGASSQSYTPGSVTQTTWFRRKVSATMQTSTYSPVLQVTVVAPPLAPTVTTPVTYCQNTTATALTATGSNLTWGPISGTAGGTGNLTNLTYVDGSFSNKKTTFTTTIPNVTITSVNYTIPSWQAVSAIKLALYNNSGTVIAISSTTTSQSAGSSPISIVNTFNYTLTSSGDYSIGIYSGSGNMGGDSTVFPITEPYGIVNVTGVAMNGTGPYHCFNNIQFTTASTSTAPLPSTSLPGTSNYSVSQTVSGCISPAATISVIVNALPSATISYGGSPFCKSVTTAQSVTPTGTTGGTYSAPSGLTINSGSGAITPSTSTAGTYTVTYKMAATGGCATQYATTSVTISALPSATISYGGTPFCNSISTAQSVTQAGTTGGIYSAPNGLSINATTGAITPSTTTPGTYTVTYTITAGGCSAQTATTSVTITAVPSATISYAGTPFCKSVSTAQNVTQTGTAGGTYSAPSGLSLNTTTGAITPSTSTAGSYTVTYTIAAAGGCSAQTAITLVTITSVPSATISYSGTPFCNSISTAQSVTQAGTTGGTYSAPAGLSLNTTTGAITSSTSTAGTYTVTYTLAAAGGCSTQTATTSITITSIPSATISYSGTPFCNSISTAQSVTQGGTTGGTYSAPAGLSINTITGAITPSASTAGTYLVTYTLAAAGGCSNQIATTTVTVTAIPSATISYAGTPYCSSAGSANVTISGTTGGSFTSDANLVMDATIGNINLATSTAGSHTIKYSVSAAGGCAAFSTTTNITITTQPYATGFYPNSPYCSNIGTLVPTGSYNGILGTLSASPSGLSINSSTGVINVAASNPGSYTIYYNVSASGGCAAYYANAPIVISTAPSATISYSAGSYCFGAGTASVTQTGTTGGVYSSTSGLIIDPSSGGVNLNTSTPNTYTVSYTIAASNGCAQYVKTCSITINAKVSSLSFSAGSTSSRCQAAGNVTYNASASNSTGIVYSLDAASLTAGNSINSSTGVVTYTAGWSGTSVITAVANGCTPLTATHSATTNGTPSVSAVTTLSCVGGSTGTITATGTNGSTPYTFNLNSGSYQSGTLFGNLAVGTYTLGIKSATGCISSTSVTVSTYPTSADDQAASATNTWIGHTYSGSNFQNYIGHFTEPESFNESFGGSTTCFGITSGATFPSIYTDNFSVRFRMNSTRQGLYVVDLGSDDGSRLYIDGNLIYNNWTPQSFSTRPRVLMSLNGSNSITYEFFENTGSNQVVFQNLTLVLANSLSTNTTQSICFGNAGSAISGDVYGTLPSGITISGTGYQWSYSLTSTGARTDISGATGATFTPNSSTAPFNTPGTYYVYRNAKVSSSNNTGINPYVATNESNAAMITISAVPSATISYLNTPFCNSSSLPESVTLTGTTGGVFSSPGLTMNASNGSIIPNQNTVAYYSVTYTIPAAGGCPSFTTSTPVYIGTPGTWSGKIDTNWDNSGNWICGQIPSSTIDANIPKMVSNFPTVISSTSEAKNINIQSGASLVIIGTIKIAGDIHNNGNFNVANGTVVMEGANAQSIAGSMFENKTIKNLVINNTGSGVSISSTANDTLKLTGLLSFGNASAILNTGDNLTLISNSAGTAAVGVVGGANSINGKVTVERYINTGTSAGQHPKAWQFLATPTSGQTIKQSWMENGTAANNYGTMISGPAGIAAGFDVASSAPSMKYFNYVTSAWTGVANTGDPVFNSQGYMVFIRGDRTVTGATQAANPTVLRTKGTLNTGSLASIIVHNNNFGSIGNPYAAPIDFTLLSKDASIDDKYYTWDPYLYGSYGTGGYQVITAVNNWKPVPGGTAAYASGVSNSIIQSGQAFFVHATSADSTGTSKVNFMENCKSVSSGSNKFSRMAGNTGNSTTQFLRASLITSSGLMADGNVVAFDKSYDAAVDGNDALKILNSGENFTVKTAGKFLAVEATSPVVSSDTIYYYTSNLAKTNYQLIFAPENMQSAGVQAFLVDKFLGTELPVSLTDSTFFNITVNATAASSASDRFKIVFRQLAALPVTITSVTATLKNKNIEVKWSVQNESGIKQYQVERSTDGSNFTQVSSVNANNTVSGNYSWTDPNVSDGTYYYRIKIISIDGKVTYTQVVKVVSGTVDQQISVYPNPIQNSTIHLQLINQPEGVYGVRLFNSAGQLIVSKKITHTKGTSEESLVCPNLAKGIYQLEVVKADGSVEIVKVMN